MNKFSKYNVFINIFLMLFTFISLLIFAEIATRIYINIKKRFIGIESSKIIKHIPDPDLGYKMQPSFAGKYNTNSDGFRDRDFNVNKNTNVFRIINLGDSVTFGLGVELEYVYNKILENMLNNELGPKINYEVLNMGISGYNSYQEYVLFKSKGLTFNPNLLLLQFFYNDSDPNISVDCSPSGCLQEYRCSSDHRLIIDFTYP